MWNLHERNTTMIFHCVKDILGEWLNLCGLRSVCLLRTTGILILPSVTQIFSCSSVLLQYWFHLNCLMTFSFPDIFINPCKCLKWAKEKLHLTSCVLSQVVCASKHGVAGFSEPWSSSPLALSQDVEQLGLPPQPGELQQRADSIPTPFCPVHVQRHAPSTGTLWH